MKTRNHPTQQSADSSAKPNRRLPNKRYRRAILGFTLLELLMGLGLSSIGLTAGLALYSSGKTALNVVEMTTEVQQGFRKAFETIALEIQETNISTIDTSVPYAISFASARQENVFQINPDRTPDWQNAVVYFLDISTNTLCRYVEAKSDWTTTFDTASAFGVANPQRLVPDVTDLEFNLSDDILTITMQVSTSTASGTSGPVTSELATQIRVRN